MESTEHEFLRELGIRVVDNDPEDRERLGREFFPEGKPEEKREEKREERGEEEEGESAENRACLHFTPVASRVRKLRILFK